MQAKVKDLGINKFPGLTGVPQAEIFYEFHKY